jgi:hypothetical protein
MANELFANLEKINITESGIQRIKTNLGLNTEDIAKWCKQQIENPETITRTDKNWNVRGDGFVITIDAQSFTILTARREKSKKGSNLSDVNIIKKLDDNPELKSKLIDVFDTKTHRNVSRYGLLLADHILQLTNMPIDEALEACYSVNQRWQDGDAKFQEARDVAFEMHELAREEKDPVKEKALRVMGQVAAIPHVKRHALIASDYAIKVINLLYPGNLVEVKKEREFQIKLMESV